MRRLLAVLLLAALGFAPAPLPRRAPRTKPAPLPAACVARWFTLEYRTAFGPGGNYSAEATWEGGSRWVGSWSLGDSPGGPVLAIHERRAEDDDWITWVIPLDAGRRRGRGEWEGRFSLEEVK